ncbi:MAG: septal ring lytic transglycosylase RlpA family protein [Deltaproteobacteria bacterium]
MRLSADITCDNTPDASPSGFCRIILAVLVIALLFLAGCSSGRHDASYPDKSRPGHGLNIGETTECLASWYGKDFHGKPTASGDIFNMYDLTCAHKVYPFGTRIKVTNLSGGKNTECIINDRGPFVPNRDLDLSYGAAKKIDLAKTGVGRVRIEVLGRDSKYVKYVKYDRIENAAALTLQVGSFRDEHNAKKLKAGLEMNHQNVYIVSAMVENDRYYRVRIGKFEDRALALKAAGPIADEGYNVLIMRYEK